jgi:hypothetical membrane protein
MRWSRAATFGGAIGPLGFVGAWIVAGARTARYSPVHDAISRLAATHAPHRLLMTAGFVCFGVGVPLFAFAVRDQIGTKAAVAAVVSGLATLGVAASPLDVSHRVDMLHGAFATVGYVALAAVPALARRSMRTNGYKALAAVAPFVTIVSALSLGATSLGPAHGLFQRVGLTATDAWLVVTASACIRKQWEPPRAS